MGGLKVGINIATRVTNDRLTLGLATNHLGGLCQAFALNLLQ